MHALDQYLRRVAQWVLPGQRNAVLQKVREDLGEIIGDEVDDAVIAQHLRAFGTPQVVAARYADYPHVIPGMLAPTYFIVLVFTLIGVFVVNLMLLIPRAIHGADWWDNVRQVLVIALSAVPWAFMAVTIVFAALGYWVQRRAHHSCS